VTNANCILLCSACKPVLPCMESSISSFIDTGDTPSCYVEYCLLLSPRYEIFSFLSFPCVTHMQGGLMVAPMHHGLMPAMIIQRQKLLMPRKMRDCCCLFTSFRGKQSRPCAIAHPRICIVLCPWSFPISSILNPEPFPFHFFLSTVLLPSLL
jgi:hypothetical protein